jgi:hypothetical protein
MEKSNFEFEGFTSFNKKYIFKGKISEENLIITTSNDYGNDIIKNNFILEINFNELKKIKIFSLYETIEEAVNGLISIIENNLESKKNNEIIFKFDKYQNEFLNLLLTNKIGNLNEINNSKDFKNNNKEIKITNFNKKNLLNLYSKLLKELNYLKNINNNFYNNNNKILEIKSNINNNILNLNKYKNLMNTNKKLIEEINTLILFNEKISNNYKKDLNFFFENISELDKLFNL